MFSIRSNSSDRELLFSNLEGDYFQVNLKGIQVSARTTVFAYTDARSLKNLFQELGKFDRPWNNTKEWGSLEGEFNISATCNALGHVLFRVEIRILPGDPEESCVKTGITTELEKLVSLAKDAEDFFSP